MRFPRCQQERTDCFAMYEGGCKALSTTYFMKPCPFYKPKEQREKELSEHEENPIYKFGFVKEEA